MDSSLDIPYRCEALESLLAILLLSMDRHLGGSSKADPANDKF